MGSSQDSGSQSGNTATVSALVVTYLRPAELESCIESLLAQTYPPAEVVVVDNAGGSDQETRDACERLKDRTRVTCLVNPENSLTVARNLGVAECDGEFVLLVDDDVTLAPDYIEQMLEAVRADSKIVGIQGHIAQGPRNRVRELLHTVFRLYHLEPNTCRVMRSISTTYAKNPVGSIKCAWISGSNQFYRREVLENVKWDEQMILYSDGEDLDHSARVDRDYPGGLRMVGTAAVHHHESAEGRLAEARFILMREAYGYYLSHKLFPNSGAARVVYAWSRVGISALTAARAVRIRSLSECRATAIAFRHVLKNRSSLRSGDLGPTNNQLVKEI